MADELSLVSTGEIAKRLGVSVALVQKLERNGQLPPALRIEGNPRRVWRSDDWPLIRAKFEARRRKVSTVSG